MPDLRTAADADVETLAQILADSFTDDPIMSWAFPDLATRPRILQALFGFLAKHRYVPQGVSTVGADTAALWQRPHLVDDEGFWDEHGAEFAASLEGELDRIGMVSAAMAEHHPSDPHLYLLAIGVRPAAQGRGLGGKVLEFTIEQADEAGEACYLEATSPRSRVLYERHGFETTGEINVADCPTMWPMWRPPSR